MLFSGLVFAVGIKSSLDIGGNAYIHGDLYLKSDKTTPETAAIQITKGSNKPAIRWTSQGWQYTNNGTTWNNFGSGGAGGGDMYKSVYDTNNNGIVDNAESVVDNSITNAKIQDNVISTNKIQDGAIIGTKISSGVITETHIATNAKILKTNEVLTLPTVSGNSGRYLKTDGSTLMWDTVSGSGTPGGNNKTIQYNNNGSFAGDDNLTWDSGLKQLSVLGSVGIGTATPQAKLDIAGNIKIADGTQGAGKVLTSDANGLASWQTPAGGSSFDYKVAYTKTSNMDLTGSDTFIYTDLILIDTNIIATGITHCYPMLQVQNYTSIALYNVQSQIDAYTKLLLHMNGTEGSTTFIDETGKTMTAYGGASITTSTYKFPPGCGSFDGSTGYLTTTASSDWNFGGDAWTIDFWVKIKEATYNTCIFSIGDQADKYISFFTAGSTMHFNPDFHSDQNNRYYDNSSAPYTVGVWYHIAFVRNGSNLMFFVNGQLKASWNVGTDTWDLSGYPVWIGCGGNTGFPNWFCPVYIDELRISKGIARWTSNFTPPDSEYGETLTQIATLTNGQDNLFTADTTGRYRVKIIGNSNLDYRGGVIYFK